MKPQVLNKSKQSELRKWDRHVLKVMLLPLLVQIGVAVAVANFDYSKLVLMPVLILGIISILQEINKNYLILLETSEEKIKIMSYNFLYKVKVSEFDRSEVRRIDKDKKGKRFSLELGSYKRKLFYINDKFTQQTN